MYANSDLEPGRLKHAKECIHCNSVDALDLKKYDANKDFFWSFFNMNLVEAGIEFFVMEDKRSLPTKHIPPPFKNEYNKKTE